MRISLITETFPPELNGVSLTVARLYRFLSDQHEVELIRPRQPHEAKLNSEIELRTVGTRIPMYPELQMGWISPERLMRRWAERRPALVHVATEGPLGAAAVIAARRLRIAVTSDLRTNFHLYSRHYRLGWAEPLVWRYLRHFHNRADRTFVPTTAMQKMLTQTGFQRVEVVGRGVDTRLFTPARRQAALRERWGVDDGTSVVLYVGRVASEKNVALAFTAFRRLQNSVPQARMVVVGDGPLRASLQASNPDVLFVGSRRGIDLAEHYASSDVFLFPSLTDTFGNVLMEALASGLTVVAFQCAAALENVHHGRNGLLAAPGDEQAFIDAACNAAADRTLRTSLGIQARTTASRLTWDGVLRRFESILLQTARQTESQYADAVAL